MSWTAGTTRRLTSGCPAVIWYRPAPTSTTGNSSPGYSDTTLAAITAPTGNAPHTAYMISTASFAVPHHIVAAQKK
jgi:hypothetical protein